MIRGTGTFAVEVGRSKEWSTSPLVVPGAVNGSTCVEKKRDSSQCYMYTLVTNEAVINKYTVQANR